MALRPRRTWASKENISTNAAPKDLAWKRPDPAVPTLDRSAELRQVNPSELRRRLVDTRAAFRTLQMAHKKLHHKIKVDRVINDAIERNENEHLKKQVLELKEDRERKEQELASKDKLIQNLKRRIAAQSRSRSYSGRNMSQIGSVLDVSNLDLSMDVRDVSPPPRCFVAETATQVSPQVRSSEDTSPRRAKLHSQVESFDKRMEEVERDLEAARRMQSVHRESVDREGEAPKRAWTVDVSPLSTVSGEGGLSVEGGLDQVNQRILCMLSTGANALQQVTPEAPDLDETTLDHESLHVSRLDDRSEAVVPHGWLIEQLQMVRDDFKDRQQAASEYCQLDSARSSHSQQRHLQELQALQQHTEQVTRERDQMAKMLHDEAERVRNTYSEPRSSRTMLNSAGCTPRDDLRPTPRVLPPSHPNSGSTTPSGYSAAMIARATSSGALLSPPMPFNGQHQQHGHGHGGHGHGKQQPRGYIKVGEHKTEHWRPVY